MAKTETYYGYEEWDAEQFRRAAHILTQIAERKAGESHMRSMILQLYFQDQGGTDDIHGTTPEVA